MSTLLSMTARINAGGVGVAFVDTAEAAGQRRSGNGSVNDPAALLFALAALLLLLLLLLFPLV